jgi:hypothetical protein
MPKTEGAIDKVQRTRRGKTDTEKARTKDNKKKQEQKKQNAAKSSFFTPPPSDAPAPLPLPPPRDENGNAGRFRAADCGTNHGWSHNDIIGSATSPKTKW